MPATSPMPAISSARPFRVEDGRREIIAGPGALIGELALIVASAAAVERDRDRKFHGHQIARSLFPARARK